MSAIDAIVRAIVRGMENQRQGGWRQDHAIPLLGHDILAALAEAGYRVVPVEPTPAMWASVNLVGRAHVSKLCSIEGWRAMLDAARVAE